MYMIYLFFSSTTWIYYFKLDKVLICYLPDILTTEKMKESTGASKAPPESSSHNNHSGSTIEIIFAERKTLGFSIVEGYCSRRQIHAAYFSGFSAMLDISFGGRQAAPWPVSRRLKKYFFSTLKQPYTKCMMMIQGD